MIPWGRRSYTNTRRNLVQGDTEMERCDALKVPIFQRSRLRRRVVSFFIRPEQDRLRVPPTGTPMMPPRAATTRLRTGGAIKILVGLRGCAWRPCVLAGFSCFSTHRDRQVQRVRGGEFTRGRVVAARFSALANGNDARSLLLRGRSPGARQNPVYPAIFQDLRPPPSE